jgi:uncharacterized membrane protein
MIVAVALFILTEDMSLPMRWMDRYTVWMAAMAIMQVVVTYFARKKYAEDEQDEQEQNAQQA